MKVAIIGGGWAGLAAGLRVQQAGHTVTLFEAARNLGGRARRIASRALDQTIDNGQHILLGAYTETLAIMRELGLNAHALFHRERLTLESTDGVFQLRALPLPAPLHLAGGIILARGLGVAERLRLTVLVTSLRLNGWRTASGLNVGQWLEQGGQSPHVIRSFWQPLCLAALNTPIERACAQLFAHVLRDSLGGNSTATDVLIPRVDLSRLWPDEAGRRLNAGAVPGAGLRLGHAVKQLDCSASCVMVDDTMFDAVIVTGNVPSTRRLLSQLEPATDSEAYLTRLAGFDFLPIATVTLQLERPWGLTRPMLMLRDDPAKHQYGQWLFDRHALLGSSAGTAPSDPARRLLHIVISDATALMQSSESQTVQAVIQQVQTQAQRYAPMPRVTGHDLIVEKRATFAALPGLARPTVCTPWPRVWVAGDWTDTGYPGVLEGAVRSGRQAAESLLASLG